MDRRCFLAQTGWAALPPLAVPRRILKPPRLQAGSTVGLVAPAGVVPDSFDVQLAQEAMAALDLKTKRGRHVMSRHGYFAGRDEDRAADLMAMFTDPDVDGIVALRGGWGAARLLEALDFDVIRQNPKVFVGFSDITTLLLTIYARTGLVTFHGPDGLSTWSRFTAEGFRRVLIGGEAVTMQNPARDGGRLIQKEDRVRTITPGMARGRLVGGNLTILTSLLGTPYLPSFDGHILFVEDIGEGIYRIDRMLTQLRLAGVLGQITGFVFGKCTRCNPDSDYGSFTLAEIIDEHIQPLGIPAWQGAMIGHIQDKLTVPLGVEAEIDAGAGIIRLLEPAVA
ncbi:MAG: S66 peptidase family protein [Rhodothermales bacterium]